MTTMKLITITACLKKMSQVWLAITLTHIHQLFYNFWHMSSAGIQKSATGITFSTISLLLTLFCSEVKWQKWRILHVNVIASLVGAFRRTLSTVQSMNGKHDCVHMWNVKVKVRALAIAPLTWVRLVTSSALQSWKWQLIGMSQWCHSALCEDEGGIILNICCKHLVLFRATWPQNRLFSEPPTVHQRKCVALYVFSVWYFARHTRI